MLVLSRKVSEEIVIAGQIRLKVIQVKGNQVRLGIVAPPDVPVRRSKICPTTDPQQLHGGSAPANPELA
jgi:carbon storage regulator